MAFIGLKVPSDTALILSEIDYGGHGEPEPPGFYHITMHHLGDEVPIEVLTEAVRPVFEVCSETRPFLVSTSHVTTFPPHPEHGTVPIICRIDSPELHALRDRLSEALDSAGVDYSRKFPEYKPHVTLAFAKGLEDEVDLHLPVPVAWGAHEIVLWGGDKGANRVVVSFPLSLGLGKTASSHLSVQEALFRGAVRLSLWGGSPGWPRSARGTVNYTYEEINHLSEVAGARGDSKESSFLRNMALTILHHASMTQRQQSYLMALVRRYGSIPQQRTAAGHLLA